MCELVRGLSIWLASGVVLCAALSGAPPFALASDRPQGAAVFLQSSERTPILDRQVIFVERLEELARSKGPVASAGYAAFIRTGLAEAAPRTGPGGRAIGPETQDLHSLTPRIERHDSYPQVQNTLVRFLREAKQGKRIIGGAPVPAGTFRETIAIQNVENGRVCSGVVVDKNAALTAAHCVCDLALAKRGTRAVVKLGDNIQTGDVRTLRVMPERTILRDIRFCEKGQANGTGFVPGADLAVVFFREDASAVRVERDGPFLFTKDNWVDNNGALRVSPARLVNRALYLADATAALLIVGFGINNVATVPDIGVKMFAEIPIASRLCGETQIAEQTGCVSGQEAVLIDWKWHQRDTCTGDSGGPAFVVVEDRYYLAAITSRAADPHGACGPGGIYSLASTQVVSWLRQVAKIAPLEH